jgi:hypothetical protein
LPASTNIATHNNLTPAEKGAIQELKERDDIVIKPADKGSDNQWCLSNVKVALLHEVEGGNRRIRRFIVETMGIPGLLTL